MVTTPVSDRCLRTNDTLRSSVALCQKSKLYTSGCLGIRGQVKSFRLLPSSVLILMVHLETDSEKGDRAL